MLVLMRIENPLDLLDQQVDGDKHWKSPFGMSSVAMIYAPAPWRRQTVLLYIRCKFLLHEAWQQGFHP
jgi:hypothetical protein